MPRFPGCEDSDLSNREKENCAKELLLDYIYETLKYPEVAKKTNVQGVSVIQFVVWKDSTIRNIKVVRTPGAGTGEAAARVVESIQNLSTKWTPGHQRDRPVCVQYTLPIKFNLDDAYLPKIIRDHKYKNLYSFDALYEKPRFPDCEISTNYDCTSESLMEFIQENQIYPEKALENGTEGTVKISFVIETTGKISSIKAHNKIHDGISEDTLGILKWMKSEDMRCTPGKANNVTVNTYYEVDVIYNIDDWNDKN